MKTEISTSVHSRLHEARYRLVGKVCFNCEEAYFPPREICPECGDKCDTQHFSGKGTLYSIATVSEAPAGHQEYVPYTVALVKLEEGPLLTAQLTDLDPSNSLEIGAELEMVTRRLKTEGERGQLVYGYKFRPVLKKSL